MAEEIKNTVLLPTAYFGPVEYFYFLNKFKNVLIEQYETWPKQTYRNRTVLVTDKGKQAITVPVVKVNGNRTKTKEIKISSAENWQKKHWRAIETAYNNSPYFLYYSDEIKDILFNNYDSLIELNTELTKVLCELMEIDCNINFTGEYKKDYGSAVLDLRNRISPKLPPVLNHFLEYIQVFSEKQAFIPNASILDLLFCLGPESKDYIERLSY